MNQSILNVKVWRGTQDGGFVEYKVPRAANQTVLDVVTYIQRKLGIGYNKAARLVEQMEDEGVVSTANHVGKREILIPER